MDTPERSEAVTSWKRWILGPAAADRALLYEELASHLAAGIGLRETVALLRDGARGRRRRALVRLEDAIRCDVAPGAAMALFPECFAPVEAMLVSAAERTGRYDVAFRAAAAEIQRVRRATGALARASMLPLVELHLGIFVAGMFVFPALQSAATGRVFMAAAYGVLWIGGVAAWTAHVAHRIRPGWGRVAASIPLFGTVVRQGAVSRACRVAAALHASGSGLPETLHAAANASRNGWIARDLRIAAEDVRRGTPASSALTVVGALDGAPRSLIETGERTGTLDAAFERIATLADDAFERAARRVAAVTGGLIFAAAAFGVFWMMSALLRKWYGGF